MSIVVTAEPAKINEIPYFVWPQWEKAEVFTAFTGLHRGYLIYGQQGKHKKKNRKNKEMTFHHGSLLLIEDQYSQGYNAHPQGDSLSL